MKKLTSLLLIAAILTSLLSLSSCGNNEPELEEPQYETITLTKYNYSDYIVFDYYSTDYDVEYSNGKYNHSGTRHVESKSRNTNYHFENVTIKLNGSVMSSPKIEGVSITLNLDSSGVAHGSDSYFILGSNFKNISENDFVVKSITGTVKIPKN